MQDKPERGEDMPVAHHQSKQALGGEVTIVIVSSGPSGVDNVMSTLWRQIFLFERRFSRFLPASELSRFNRRAGLQVPITPAFEAVLRACQAMSHLNNEWYNPFILPALQRAGYVQSALPGYEDDAVEDYRERQVTSADRLEVGDGWARIPYGTALDLGGMGKGYLADRLADYLDKQALEGYWVSLSGDMVAAGYDEAGLPWQTVIQSAYQVTGDAPYVVQHTGKRMAVATSGTFRRDNQRAGAPWHHLINPQTGQPATTDVLMATVVDAHCLHADVLASCAVMVGSRQAWPYLKQRGAQGAYIQATKARVTKHGSMLKLKQSPKAAKSYA